MATLELKSYEQILGTLIRKVQSESGLTDLEPGSVVLSILEAAAESDFSIAADILAALDSIDLDRADGAILDLLAAQKGLSRLPASKASGPVTITDTSFTKTNTTIYQGQPAPIANSTIIYVNDASTWPSTGRLYIGRNTSNVEGPLPYTSIVAVGNYFQITLGSSTNKFHNTGETVVLAQGGNRTIPSGTKVNTGVIGSASPVSFSILDSVTLIDGEDSITGISCICDSLGTTGNIPSDAITTFPSPPFPNLQVSNAFPFTNARDEEGDIELRDRIKLINSTNINGTNQAIINAVTNLVASDEQKRILSASIAEATGNDPTILYVDDGTAYEPIYTGVGQEIILDNAVGGQKFLQLVNPGLVKAQITSLSTEPFNIEDGSILSVLVGGVVSEHVFSSSDFFDSTSATAYEVVASINADPDLLYTARTAEGATKIVLTAKADSGEDVEISSPSTGVNANDLFNFQTGKQYTLKLYKNDNELIKDGSSAIIESTSFPWGLTSLSYTLILSIDGTPSVTYTFNSSNLAPYNPQNAPISAWADAINATIPGATGVVSGNKLQIVSNKGASDNASIQILGGTLVTTAGIFSNTISNGQTSDYSLVRGTGQIILTDAASTGDTFKAGTTDTRAYVQSDALTSGVVSVSLSANLYVLNDQSIQTISTGAVAGVSLTSSSNLATWWRFVGPANTFVNVQIGDWVIITDSGITDSNNQGFFRVNNTDSSTFIEVKKTTGTAGSYTLLNNNGIQFFRSSSGIVQRFSTGASNQSLAQWASALNNNSLVGISAKVADTDKLRLTTNTFNSDTGQIYLLASDAQGANFEFTTGDSDVSTTSHIGFIETNNSEVGTPEFVATLSGGNSSVTNSAYYEWPGINPSVTVSPDKMIKFVKAFNTSTSKYYGNNVANWTSIQNVNNASTTIFLLAKPSITDRFLNDRGYIAHSFDLSDSDSLFLVFDNSPVDKSVKLNAYRTLSLASSPAPTPTTFRATDVDGGNIQLTTSFGSTFDFTNYKAYSRARAVVDCDGTNNGFIVRSAKYGPYGNKYNFYLAYPAGPNTSYSYSLNSGNTAGGVDLIVALPSNAARATTYDGTTSFTISYSNPNATFLWNSGTTPTFVSNGVLAGDIALISTNSSFTLANTGVFRVTNVSQTTFTVTNYNASATSDSIARTLGAASNLQFYPISATSTANALIAWMNSNVNNYVTATLGVGETGAGLVDRTIRDFTGSTQNFVSLVDGENWVSSSTVSASGAQFTLAQAFSLTTGGLYTLVGEQIKFIPHTAKQIVSFFGSPAVSGISNLGEIKVSDQGGKVQIASSVVGTAGAIKVDGGSANSVGGTIVGTATPVGSPANFELIRTTFGSTNGVYPGMWLKFISGLPLSKNVGLSASSLAGITLPNVLSITGGSFFTQRTYTGDNTTHIQVEKHGDFAAYNYANIGTTSSFTNVQQGDWVVISSGVSFNSQNAGTFRVVRSVTNTFWVENSEALNEEVTLSANSDLTFYSSDSILTGDQIILAGNVLGATNNGTYTVLNVSGTQTLNISGNFAAAVSLTSLSGNRFSNINFYNSSPTNFYKSVNAVASPSALNSSYDDIIVNTNVSQLSGKISDTFEFTFEGLNKLDFPTETNFGIDGYSYYNGLIGEATKVVYGDPENSTLFPGVKATSAYIDIRPPLPKRIQISVGVRLKTGVIFSDVENTIKSAIASVVNSSKIGQSIALGDIITAISSVDGVFAPSIIYPTFNSSNDVIEVNYQEKALIISQEDINVSLLGN